MQSKHASLLDLAGFDDDLGRYSVGFEGEADAVEAGVGGGGGGGDGGLELVGAADGDDGVGDGLEAVCEEGGGFFEDEVEAVLEFGGEGEVEGEAATGHCGEEGLLG